MPVNIHAPYRSGLDLGRTSQGTWLILLERDGRIFDDDFFDVAFAGGEQRRAGASVRLGAEETLAWRLKKPELIGGAQEPVCDTPLNRSRQGNRGRFGTAELATSLARGILVQWYCVPSALVHSAVH